MRRWHEERELMLGRWRREIALHEGVAGGRGHPPLPPIAAESGGPEICHCYRGMGFVRKKRPGDCGKPRCVHCHLRKFYDRPARQHIKRTAIEADLCASGARSLAQTTRPHDSSNNGLPRTLQR
ncbi:MAG: hypothetical protein ACLP50_33930 [Solirubrobacteraceae bacterium]